MAENTENKDSIGFYKVLNPDKLNDTRTEYPNSFIHFHNDGKEDNLYIGDCRMTDNFNTGDVPETAKTISLGGLSQSTIKDLKSMSLSEIIMQLICPKTFPTVISNPSMTISYSGEKLIKVGSRLPVSDDIKKEYNKGKWSDETDYAGEPSNPVISMTPDKWGEMCDEGNYVISGSVHFNDGAIPKDSYGEDLPDKQYKGGDISSNSIRITSVYSIQINTDDITEMKNQGLVDYINSNPVLHITVPAENDGTLDKFKIYLPYEFKSIEVKQYNPVSGKYDIQIDMLPMDDCSYHYIRTKDTKNTNTGSAQYEIKLTR